MRGPELHTLLVTRPDPLSTPAGRTPAGNAGEGSAPSTAPSSGGPAAPATEIGDGIAARRWRYLASGGYQVHNGRAATLVVNG